MEATVCPHCNFTSSTKGNLKKHVARVHKKNEHTPEPKHTCDQCQRKFFSLNEMKSHYASDHDYRPVYEEHCFPTMSAFHSWKEKMEKDTHSHFVVVTGVKRDSAGKKVRYFYCHRSGKFRPHGTGKRKLKRQGSVKCGRRCFAMMTATESRKGVNVVFQRTHLNHDSDVSHAVLSDSERAAIAEKLRQGVAQDAVLDEIRESLDGTLKGIHLLARQDLYNVMRDCKVTSSERLHKDDHTSVLLWVKQMQAEKDNPVLFFKNRGQADRVGLLGRQASDLLDKDDFMLAIMTAPQQELLQKLGTDRMCVDWTHGTPGFDFQLVTVLCVDELGVGFPVAYCITSRLDQTAMTTFFKSIRKKTGCTQATTLMSNDEPTWYNAWKEIMGGATHRLLCAWHVDQDLREAIRKHVADKELQAFTYKALRTVVDAPCEERFEYLLKAFLTWCDLEGEEGLLKFKEYFVKCYAKRPEVWAACHRKRAGINANMRLEALHRVIRYCHKEGKRNKRVDRLISLLLKLTRNKIFDRLIRLVKNTAESAFDRETQTRHDAGAGINQDCVKQAGISQWTVRSPSSPTTTYVVTEHKWGVCQESCALTCPTCKVCVHNVTCCCPDNVLRRNMCEHIHAVFFGLVGQQNNNGGTADVEPDVQGSLNDHSETEDMVVHSLIALHWVKAEEPTASPGSCLPMLDAIRNHLQHPELDQQAVPWLTPILQNVMDQLASSAAPVHLPATNGQQ